MRPHWMLRGGKAIVFLIAGAFVLGLIVMLLWNAIIPDVFHVTALSYWQAIGLVILARILFHGPGFRVGGSWMKNKYKNRFQEKLASMTPEEREQFRAQWKQRCGYDPGEAKV